MSAVEDWERQPGEPIKAFNAFATYRGMGDDRSVTKVRDEAGFAASHRMLLTWAEAHRWVERAAAWDRYLDRQAQKAVIEERQAQARREITTGQVLQQVGLAYVQENLNTAEERKRHMTTGFALRFVKTGTDLEREGLGLNDPDKAVDASALPNELDAGVKDTFFGQIRGMAENIHAVRQLAIGPKVTSQDDDEPVDAELVDAE